MNRNTLLRLLWTGWLAWDIRAAEPLPRVDVTSIPSNQISIDDGLPQVHVGDEAVAVHASADGGLIVLSQEGDVVHAQASTDGGVTFEPDVFVFGGPGQRLARSFASAYEGGSAYVVAVVPDPIGGLGLQFRRSADLGRTWSPPVDLVAHGAVYHDIASLAGLMYTVSAGPGGRVGVVFTRDYYAFVYATVSTDGGATWTTPARVDAGANLTNSGAYTTPDLAFGPTGVVHVAYAEYQVVDGVTRANALKYTRSLDSGSTFEPERVVANRGREPDLTVAADGSILIVGADGSRLVVLRSTDGGGTFASSPSSSVSGYTFRYPRIVASSTSGTVVVASSAVVNTGPDPRYGALYAMRSTNYGASFGSLVLMAGTAARSAPALRRTPAGAWNLAWSDVRSDTYVRENTDVYAVSSGDDGATWSTAVRVDGGAAGSAPSMIGPNGSAVNASGSLVFAWADGRGETGSTHVRSNRSPAHPLSFSGDARIDATDVSGLPEAYDQDLAADGAGAVYVAFPAAGSGAYTDLRVAASLDGGRTFGPAVVASASPEGQVVVKFPKVVARPDGRVYVLYGRIDPTSGNREIRLARSSDHGATWDAAPTLVGVGASAGSPSRWSLRPDFDRFGVVLTGPDAMTIAWTDRTSIRVGRSTDDGATFAVADVDGNVGFGDHYAPALCGRGDALVLAFTADETTNGLPVVWGRTSSDGGANWTAPVRLTTPTTEVSPPPMCAVSPGIDAFVAWSDYRNPDVQVYGTRWNGTVWEPDRPVLAVPGQTLFDIQLTYTGPASIAVVAGRAWFARSSDGGATFGAPQQLDEAAPVPDATSFLPGVASDGTGNLWAAWWDRSASVDGSIVVRHSADHGATFGPVLRLNRDTPQGHRSHYGWSGEFPGDVAGGAFLLAFQQSRRGNDYAIVVNAHDPGDLDRDGTSAASDCDDSDPGVELVPSEVTGLTVSAIPGGVRVAWNSQAQTAGSATVHDVAAGTLGSLRASAGFDGASCIAEGIAGVVFDDLGSVPVEGDGNWYLARARNTCGTATFGPSTLSVCP